MELAELWTSFEAISELTGIDMPVRTTHIHCHPAIVRTHYCSFLVSDLFETKKQRSRKRRLFEAKERRNEGNGDTRRKNEWWVAGDEGMRGAGGAAAVDQGQELADRAFLPRRSLRRFGLAALTGWLRLCCEGETGRGTLVDVMNVLGLTGSACLKSL